LGRHLRHDDGLPHLAEGDLVLPHQESRFQTTEAEVAVAKLERLLEAMDTTMKDLDQMF
jgi:hypothetical protein